ncbi:MAPEG family protein [Sessilibacter corallicola]|uniref:MAPEG family protein n=1 Tax=Sessilibacter corallicola TaxID=2904075 RepID=A0ABQ0A767_9GAMM
MAFSALAIVLVITQYLIFVLLTARARVRYSIKAPATVGHPVFERTYRVQMNTLELLIIVVPGIWLTGLFVDPYWLSPLLGVLFAVARLIYCVTYIRNPTSRGFGVAMSFLVAGLFIVCSAYGAIAEILYSLNH